MSLYITKKNNFTSFFSRFRNEQTVVSRHETYVHPTKEEGGLGLTKNSCVRTYK